MVTQDAQTTDEKHIAFEKARLEYCSKMYEREEQRRETLEKKSQFYLSFITLFLGAIFLNTGSVKTIVELTAQKPITPLIVLFIYVSVACLAFSLLFSLLAVLLSMRLQGYQSERPTHLVSELFAPNTRFLVKDDESSVFQSTAKSYAIATEFNASINNTKSKWVYWSSIGVFASVISLAVFISLLAYVLFT